MKRTTCVHWNYGHYGPIKKCMIGMECKPGCDSHERRSMARKRRASHRTILRDRQDTGIKPGVMVRSKECRHLLIEKVAGILLKNCTVTAKIKSLHKGCPKNCVDREKL